MNVLSGIGALNAGVWLCTTALVMGACPAFAQSVAEPPSDQSATEADSGAEILVTANRREQSVRDVAMAVSAYGGAELARLNVESGVDIVRLTPGVFLSNAAAGQSQQYSIRGVTQNDFNDIFEGPIAVYYDDTYVPSLQGQVFGTFDLERVEVLKGPQGTLFGKNATGGLIHFIPRQPTNQFEGFAEISYGSFDTVRGEGAISGPLSDDVRARASVLYSRQGSYLQNVYPAGLAFPSAPPTPRFGEDLGKEDMLAGRLQIEADVTDRLNLRLAGTAARLKLGTAPYTSRALVPVFNAAGQHVGTVAPPAGTPDGLGFVAPLDHQQTASDFARGDGYYLRSYDVSLHTNLAFDGFDLIAVSSYKRFEKSIAVDVDGGAVNFLALGTANSSDSFTQEIRLAGETDGKLSWATGAFFSSVSADSNIGFLAPRNSLFAESLGAGPVGVDLINQVTFKNTNYSVFAQVDYPLSDHFKVVLGGRLIHERLRYSFASSIFANTDDYAIDTDVLLVPGIQPSTSNRVNDTLWAGKFTLEYRSGDGSLIYASINRGVKGGAFNGKLPDNSPPLQPSEIPYGPETLYSYELGAKTALFDNLLRLSAAVFYYDYKDYQTFALQNASGIIRNNDAHVWGAEVDAQFTIGERLRGGLAMAYTKATVENVAIAAATPTAPAVLADVRPTFSPRFQLSGNLAYELPFAPLGGKLSLLTDGSYISSFYDNIRNFAGQRHDGYALVNAGLAWTSADAAWTLKFYVKNVFEAQYVETAFDVSTLCGCSEIQYSKPRRWTVSLRKEF